MSDKIAFKIESLPKLEGLSNYTRWAGALRLTLEAYDLWDIVDGTREHPTTSDNGKEKESSAEEVAKWRKLDSKAKATIMFSVLDDDLTTVTDAASSKEAWQALGDLDDCDTVNTTINLLKNITERKLVDGASLQDHLTGFHNDWIRLKDWSLKGSTKMTKTL